MRSFVFDGEGVCKTHEYHRSVQKSGMKWSLHISRTEKEKDEIVRGNGSPMKKK